MSRVRTRFVCQECGAMAVKWQGRCTECNQWNTLVEEVVGEEQKLGLSGPAASTVPLDQVTLEATMRTTTGVSEFDRVLGGGLVEGSLVLVGGPPGAGKSTLMLQVAHGVATTRKRPVLYVTGEESVQQTRMRADRLGVNHPNILLLPEVNVDLIGEHITKSPPSLLLVDSIQTLFRPDLTAAPGSVGQVRECASTLMRLAKSLPVTVILVGHVTKDGALAGPRVLEHLVDTVLYFEGEGMLNYRMLKAVKNRFGSTNEVGIFEMESDGLRGRPNASELFLAYRQSEVPGSCVVPVVEGTRACLVEVQALVTQSPFNMPSRRSTGVDNNRVAVLLAVLERRAGVGVGGHDVFVNVVGGLRIEEPALDLGIMLAVASAVYDIPIAPQLACLGEVGLGGEIRGVDSLEKRLAECAQVGFTRCIVPAKNLHPRLNIPSSLAALPATTLEEAIGMAFDRPIRGSRGRQMAAVDVP